MDLNEIETKADELAAELSKTISKGQAEMLEWQLRGLANLAHIKSINDQRANHNVAVDMRVRELAAMEAVAEKMPTVQPVLPTCDSQDKFGRDQCVLPVGHGGRHQNGDIAPLSWPNEEELPQCGHRWQWRETDAGLIAPFHYEICTLSPDHAGSHRNAVTGVSAVATEPLSAPTQIGAVVRTDHPNPDDPVFFRWAFDSRTHSPWLLLGNHEQPYRTDEIGRITEVLSEGVDL